MAVRAWRVHDTGLVALPGRFRRLTGRVRHHGGAGGWPAQVDLAMEDQELVVRDGAGELVGRWPAATVTVRRHAVGPPVQLVVEVDGAAHLLAAPAGPDTDALLAALGS